MQNSRAILLAVIVVTAFIGAPGTAAGTQSVGAEFEQSEGDRLSADFGGKEPMQTANSDTCEFPLNVTDATGTEITLDERPDRITTTNPSAAQTLWEIGAQDRVVGVTQFAGYLNGTDDKTNVSAAFGVSVEKVVATDPDLVLAPNASAGQVANLRDQNLTVYHFPAATDVDDIAAKTERTGRLVGNCEAATEINNEMNESVDDVENRTADLDRPDALYPLGGGYVAADQTFINEIMQIGGTTNVAASEGDGYPQLSNEVILQTNPEVILVTDSEASILGQEPYASTSAGMNNNYVVLNSNYLNQPAPRSVIESTETLATGVEDLHSESETDDGRESSGSDGSSSDSDDGDEDSDEKDKTTVDEDTTAVDENTTAIDGNTTAVGENQTATNMSAEGNTTEIESESRSHDENNETGGADGAVDADGEQDVGQANTTSEETESETPGFGIVVTALAVLGFVFMPLRR